MLEAAIVTTTCSRLGQHQQEGWDPLCDESLSNNGILETALPFLSLHLPVPTSLPVQGDRQLKLCISLDRAICSEDRKLHLKESSVGGKPEEESLNIMKQMYCDIKGTPKTFFPVLRSLTLDGKVLQRLICFLLEKNAV